MLDFIRLASKHNIPYLETGHHHCHRGWVQTHCPLCAGGRGGWHLGFNLEQGTFRCWRCGALKFRDVIPALLHMDPHQAWRTVHQFQRGGDVMPAREPVVRQRQLAPPLGTGDLQPSHKKYLQRRHFDPDGLVMTWGVAGTAGMSGSWSWRVIIPIHNATGKIVAYQGRSIGDAPRKYKLTDDADCLEDPRELLYGMHKITADDWVIVVEGVTGVWRLGPGTVATFGIDWRVGQANRLRHFKRRYVIFDPEPVAQKRAEALADHLSIFPGTTEVVSGFATDPGDFSPAEAEDITKELQCLP